MLRRQQLLLIAARQRRRRHARRKGLLVMVAVVAGLVGTLGVTAADRYNYYSSDLPDPNTLNPQDLATGTQILDRNGKLLYLKHRSGEIRSIVALKDMSPLLRQATIDLEDKNFYSHQGLDYQRLVGAALADLTKTGGQQGGSTITQQLAKFKYLTNGGSSIAERSLDRKAKEALLAQEIEARYSKDQILEAYLNEIFYGRESYGIEAASQTYFGKHASELDLNEATLLAGIPQAPAKYSPLNTDGSVNNENLANARDRQKQVLDAMSHLGHITPFEAATTLNTPLKFNPQQTDRAFFAPHFVVYVLNYLERQYGTKLVEGGGLKVTTTLDLNLQATAENIVRNRVAAYAGRNINNGAMVALDPNTGGIVAYVGSADYNNKAIAGQFDNVDGGGLDSYGGRQPGSSFKPYVYITALANGWTPGTLVNDTQGAYGGTHVFHDFDSRSEGIITVRRALVESRNIPPVVMMAQLTPRRVLQTVRAMGITTLRPATATSQNDENLATAIGSGSVRMLEHASAYGVFATGGVYRPANPLLKVEDVHGKSLPLPGGPREGTHLFTPQVTYELNDILLGYGKQWHLNLVGPAAGKSGTTENGADLWYMGYTPNLVVASWMAHTGFAADGTPLGLVPLPGQYGVETSAHMFEDFLAAFYKGTRIPDFTRPPGIVTGGSACRPAPPLNIQAPPGSIPSALCQAGDIHINGY
jgi:membrane peptidoglycan carboxypeptidase